jgi:cytochrome b561
LQIGYSDALPELTYLVLIDKIYLLAYILIVLTLVRTILAFQKCNQATEQSMESLLQMDKRLISLQLLVFALGTAVLGWVH